MTDTAPPDDRPDDRDLPDRALIKHWWTDLDDTSDGTSPLCRLRSMLSACALDATRAIGPERAADLLATELAHALESARVTFETIEAARAADAGGGPKPRAVH